MGHAARANNVLLLLGALDELLTAQGHPFDAGRGVAAANEVYHDAASA